MIKKLMLFSGLFLFSQSAWAAYPNYTVCPSSCDFNSLEGAVNDLSVNHSTPASPVTITISGSWVSADTTAVYINGITTSATNTITISTTGTARHNGTAKTVSGLNNYTLNMGGSASTPIEISVPYVSVTGLEILNWSGSNDGIRIDNVANTTIDSCIIHDGGVWAGIGWNNAVATIIRNNIIYNVGEAIYAEGTGSAYGSLVDNNTVYGNGIGIQDAGYYPALRNNIAYNNTTDYSGSFAGEDTNNLSKDGTAPPYHTYYTNAALNFVNAAAYNFNLAPTDSAAILQGENLTSDPYAPFTNDTTGTTRQSTGAWDLGAVMFNGYPNYTVCPSGCNFNSLYGAVNDVETNHSILTNPVTITISGTWASADTTPVGIGGITTSGTNTLTITATGAARNSGYFVDASPYYRLEASRDTSTVLYIDTPYTTITGIQIENTYTGTDNYTAAVITGSDSSPSTIFDADIFVSKATGTIAPTAGQYSTGDNGATYRDTIFIGPNGVDQGNGYGGANYVYDNCVFIGTNGYGFLARSGGSYGATINNSYAYGTSGGYSLAGSDNTLVDDASSDSSGTSGLQNIAYSTTSGAYFTNITSGSENFTLNAGSALIGTGTNLYSTFTDDILGSTRQSSGGWDVGAFKYNVTAGLIGWWKFDEGAGSTAIDSSGSGNTGTEQNSPSYVTGKVGPYALSFNGSNQYVSMTSNPVASLSTGTIAFWFQSPSYSASYAMVYQDGCGFNDIYVGFPANSSSPVGYGVGSNSGINTNYSSFALNTWYHIAITWDGSHVISYINGSLDQSNSLSNSTSSCGNCGLQVGRYAYGASCGNPGNYFPGIIDDVRVYNRALSAGDVAQLYASGATTNHGFAAFLR